MCVRRLRLHWCLILANFDVLQQQQAPATLYTLVSTATSCVQVRLSDQSHEIQLSWDFQRMSSRMIAVSPRVCRVMLQMFWFLLTVCDAADRHDAKRQDQSHGKEAHEAAGDLPDGTDLPPPPPKPKSKEKSNGKEAAGERMVQSVNVKTETCKLFVLACPVTLAKGCAMHMIECCCMSGCLLGPALSLCNPVSRKEKKRLRLSASI